jgi:hypothetical protein
VLEGADNGAPIVVADPSCTAAKKLTEVALRVVEELAELPAR